MNGEAVESHGRTAGSGGLMPRDAQREHPAAQPDAGLHAVPRARAVRSALVVALLNGVVIGTAEYLVGTMFADRAGAGTWPLGLRLAAAGRLMVTQALFWLVLLLFVGAVPLLPLRKDRRQARYAWLLSVSVAIAAGMILPLDLLIAHRATTVLVTVCVIGGCALGAAVYVTVRRSRPVQDWCERLEARVGLAALACVAVTGGAFACSPFRNAGTYRVPAGAAVPGDPGHVDVLWIVLDTVRADRIGSYGCPRPTTPFLDEWAARCLVFERVFTDGTWTVPTHASMFTGVPARTHGCFYAQDRLADEFETVAEVLQRRGYATALFSNNALVGPGTNMSQGFGAAYVIADAHKALPFSLARLAEELGWAPCLPWLDPDFGAALTNCLVDRWLGRQAGRPVFVFINYMEAHLPYRVPRAYRERMLAPNEVRRSYRLARRAYGNLAVWLNMDAVIDGYERMPESDRRVVKGQYESTIRYLDERLRETIDIFRRRGRLANTLVIVTADHGEYLDTHGMWSHHFLSYNDLVHVPLFIHVPGQAGGRRVQVLAQSRDLYPTVLNHAVGRQPQQWGLSARDLLEAIELGMEDRIAIVECSGPEAASVERLSAKSKERLRHRAAAQLSAVDYPFKYIQSRDGSLNSTTSPMIRASCIISARNILRSAGCATTWKSGSS